MTQTQAVKLIKNEWADGTEQAREDWETVTKQKFRLLPYRFECDGKEYVSFLIGAAYPTHERKGGVVVFGVTPDDYVLSLMESREASDVYQVFRNIAELRYKYGYGLVRGHIEYITGDEERYQSVVAKVNEGLEMKLGEGRGIYFKSPADLDQTNCMALYLHHLRQAMKDEAVELNNDPLVVEELRQIKPDEAGKGKYQDYPIAGLVGGMVHTILYEDRQKEEHQPENVSDCAFNLDDISGEDGE